MSSSQSSIRRVSEDPKLRPFLSNHFDSQAYIKGIIKEGNSEECFNDISNCITQINEEIKGYISQHKDELMSGMQDVAVLSERYEILSSTSQKLTRNVDRLKKDALESFDLVKNRTIELERIHHTNLILRKLRQFAHAKAQLNHHVKISNPETSDNMIGGDNIGSLDIRYLATAAKILSELESLIIIPALLEISLVSVHVNDIKKFGIQLREKAQEMLLIALKERNQAAIATSLQVFFNLQSLPEIILLAIDLTIKSTVEISRKALDFDTLIKSHPDLNPTKTNNVSVGVNNVSNRNNVSNTNLLATQVNSSQLRVAMREISHQWSTLVLEQAMQIQVLQRVLLKKEDPSSHKKFIDVMKIVSKSNQQLGDSKLLELYWTRLSSSIQDLANSKLKNFPNAAIRIYPYLRQAAVEVVDNLHLLCERDNARDGNGGVLSNNNISKGSRNNIDNLFGNDTTDINYNNTNIGGMFGSIGWAQNDLMCSISTSIRSKNKKTNANNRNIIQERFNNINNNSNRNNNNLLKSDRIKGLDNNGNNNLETGLVAGLKPLKDRYLINCLNRMSGPVLQMFPEMEGYTAAVPSKRDLQALIKAIQVELVTATVEGECGLVRIICKEASKTIKLMLTKIEGITINGVETKKITTTNSFLRSSQQEHNGQLISLLFQLRTSLVSLPALVVKLAQETPGSALAVPSGEFSSSDSGISSFFAVSPEEIENEINSFIDVSIKSIDDISYAQLLCPIVEAMTLFVKSSLLGLLKEGIAFTGSSSHVNSLMNVDCSKVVQNLLKQIPDMINSHLHVLGKIPCVYKAIDEFVIRVMHCYITISSLVRPVTEQSRLRTSSDMTSLESMLVGLSQIKDINNCPVHQEFKSFRRLLFDEESNSNKDTTINIKKDIPSRNHILSLSYISSLRPSTLLAYLIACSPSQLPLPYEISEMTLQLYIDNLTNISNKEGHEYLTVKSLYSNKDDYRYNRTCQQGERQTWDAVQSSLDLFLQRIAVLESQDQKNQMRLWYELILEIGGSFFG